MIIPGDEIPCCLHVCMQSGTRGQGTGQDGAKALVFDSQPHTGLRRRCSKASPSSSDVNEECLLDMTGQEQVWGCGEPSGRLSSLSQGTSGTRYVPTARSVSPGMERSGRKEGPRKRTIHFGGMCQSSKSHPPCHHGRATRVHQRAAPANPQAPDAVCQAGSIDDDDSRAIGRPAQCGGKTTRSWPIVRP